MDLASSALSAGAPVTSDQKKIDYHFLFFAFFVASLIPLILTPFLPPSLFALCLSSRGPRLTDPVFFSSEKRTAHSANFHPNTSNTWLHKPNHHPRLFITISNHDDAFSRLRSLSLRLRLELAELHGGSRPDRGAGI